jgi:hypothetical protein
MCKAALVLAFLSMSQSSLLAQGKASTQPVGHLAELIHRHIGQVVELRLTSGEKISGKVERIDGAGDQTVHLSQLGAEFFEADVRIEHVSAVVVRTKK